MIAVFAGGRPQSVMSRRRSGAITRCGNNRPGDIAFYHRRSAAHALWIWEESSSVTSSNVCTGHDGTKRPRW